MCVWCEGATLFSASARGGGYELFQKPVDECVSAKSEQSVQDPTTETQAQTDSEGKEDAEKNHDTDKDSDEAKAAAAKRKPGPGVHGVKRQKKQK